MAFPYDPNSRAVREVIRDGYIRPDTFKRAQEGVLTAHERWLAGQGKFYDRVAAPIDRADRAAKRERAETLRKFARDQLGEVNLADIVKGYGTEEEWAPAYMSSDDAKKSASVAHRKPTPVDPEVDAAWDKHRAERAAERAAKAEEDVVAHAEMHARRKKRKGSSARKGRTPPALRIYSEFMRAHKRPGTKAEVAAWARRR